MVCRKKGSVSVRRCGVFFLEHLPQLLAQLRAVLVAVHGYRVLYRGAQQFVFVVGGDRHRALRGARMVAAVDVFPGHDGSFTPWGRVRRVAGDTPVL